jgi:hypothetical protein
MHSKCCVRDCSGNPAAILIAADWNGKPVKRPKNSKEEITAKFETSRKERLLRQRRRLLAMMDYSTCVFGKQKKDDPFESSFL